MPVLVAGVENKSEPTRPASRRHQPGHAVGRCRYLVHTEVLMGIRARLAAVTAAALATAANDCFGGDTRAGSLLRCQYPWGSVSPLPRGTVRPGPPTARATGRPACL